MLNFCPSPEGKGDHVPFLKILRAEKLLKETPNVPTTRPPPQPPESSIWSEDFSSTIYSIALKTIFRLVEDAKTNRQISPALTAPKLW